MSECGNADIRDLLPDVAHGASLTVEERAAVDAHLRGCAACREELALLESVRRAHAQAPAVDVARIAAALPRPGARDARTRGAGHAWQRAAAVAVVAVGVSSLLVARAVWNGDGPVVPDTSGSVAVVGEAPAVTLGYRLGDLTEQDLEALLGKLDELDAVPAVEPGPVIAPLGGEDGTE